MQSFVSGVLTTDKVKKDRQSWTDRELFNSNGPVSGVEVQADDGLRVHKIRAR